MAMISTLQVRQEPKYPVKGKSVLLAIYCHIQQKYYILFRESTNETLTAEEVQLSVCQNMGKEVSGDSAEKDHQILRSILDDGQYDISAEDRKALESVIANLEVSKEQ